MVYTFKWYIEIDNAEKWKTTLKSLLKRGTRVQNEKWCNFNAILRFATPPYVFNDSEVFWLLRNQFVVCFKAKKGNTEYTFQHFNGNALTRALHLEPKRLRGVAKLDGALQILTF